MRKTTIAAAAAASLALALSTAPAHADIGPDVWTKTWEVEGGPGATLTTATVRTLDCEHILVEEQRTDRATRYYRVENAFPHPDAAAAYPNTKAVTVVLEAEQKGWNMVRGWTFQSPGLDWEHPVWVPPCADDRSPLTAPPF